VSGRTSLSSVSIVGTGSGEAREDLVPFLFLGGVGEPSEPAYGSLMIGPPSYVECKVDAEGVLAERRMREGMGVASGEGM
jgi:hypothetical protein